MLSFRVLVATHPRQPANFFPGLTATLFPIPELRSLPHFREFAHKSFSCNTYEYPRKCCKQKTYSMGKPFRCNTYKKQGATPPAFRPSPFAPPALHHSYFLTHFLTHFLTSLLPRLLRHPPVARWTDGLRQGIISCLHQRQGSQLFQRRGNEHFSKRTEPGGVVSLRIHGYAAVDRRAVRRIECRAGRAGLCRLFHAVAAEPGPREPAETEEGSDRATGPGEFAHRGFEKPDGNHHAESGLDAIGDRQGQEPRGNDRQGAASGRPEDQRATEPGAKGK